MLGSSNRDRKHDCVRKMPAEGYKQYILCQFQKRVISLHLLERLVEEALDIGLEICVEVQQTGVGKEKQKLKEENRICVNSSDSSSLSRL